MLCLCALTFTLLQSLLHFMVCYGLMQTTGFGGEISVEETVQKVKKWTSVSVGVWFCFVCSVVKAYGRMLCMLTIPGVGQLVADASQINVDSKKMLCLVTGE